MTSSIGIGNNFERKIANMLHDELGLKFHRDLEQYRTKDHGDLLCEVDFPFSIEFKKRSKGTTYASEWYEQSRTAAQDQGKIPCVIYQLNRSPIRVVIDLNVIIETFGGHTIHHENLVEPTFQTFCMIAREMLQPNPMSDKNSVEEPTNSEYRL